MHLEDTMLIDGEENYWLSETDLFVGKSEF